MADDVAPFPYLRWAKQHLDRTEARSLGLSGRLRPDPDAVGVPLPWPPDGPDAFTAYREAVARHTGARPEQVYPACGTSHANFACYMAFARGGRVAVETPAYESLPCMAGALGANLETFRRVPEQGWRIDPDDLDRAIEEGVDLLAVTDLHNPTGTRLHPEDLDLLTDVADKYDAVVLIDEVYRELDPEDRPTAALHHPRVLATASLTKTYGLWDLRAGWVLGDAARIHEIARWDDLVCPTLAPAPLFEAAGFLPRSRPHLEATREASRIATDQVDAWVRSRDDVRWTKPDGGFTGLLLLDEGRHGGAVADALYAEDGIRIVPGSFFQIDAAVRISYLLEPARLDEALGCLGRALDRTASGTPTRDAPPR